MNLTKSSIKRPIVSFFPMYKCNTHSGFLEALLDHTDHHPFDKVQWLVGIRREEQRTLYMNVKDVRSHLSGSSIIKLKTNTFHNGEVHLLSTCSPSRTSATGSPLCWVETPDHHLHPSGTVSSCEKKKKKQHNCQPSVLIKKTKQKWSFETQSLTWPTRSTLKYFPLRSKSSSFY